jgi:hypothetical protein
MMIPGASRVNSICHEKVHARAGIQAKKKVATKKNE